MKRNVTLTITSLLAILFFSLHWADEVARGLEPGTMSASGGFLILAVWLSATLVFPERRFGLVLGASGMITAVLAVQELWRLPWHRPRARAGG